MRLVAYPSRGRGAVALVGVAMMSRDGPRMRARRKNSAVVTLSSVADGGGQELSWQPNRSVTRRTARIARCPKSQVDRTKRDGEVSMLVPLELSSICLSPLAK
uniref:(California timema) hypothetical protein n=1 Tax=Timema californicum TaxID=61474 RepID=A0A7R9J4C6_TIMCA|nr:unnamed protein product [Timema californicum]